MAEAARAKYSIGHIEKIELDALGTHPQNRGGLGVSAFHAHRVARSIITDGFSRHRYRDATVVMVPASALGAFRRFNQVMASSDPKLPPHSQKARFALLSKNHLVAALKLLQIGSYTMGPSEEPIAPPPSDAPLEAAMREGIYCDVLGEGLWSDTDAVAAILAEDNLNASVEMGTNEVEILSFMGAELSVKAEESSAKARFQQIVQKARGRFGCSAFCDADFLHLHNFAVRVPNHLLRNLCEMHFALVPASTLRCKAAEYDAIARLDRGATYSKIALVVSLYLGGPAGESGGARRTAVGGVASVCKGISKDALKRFEESPAILQTVELFLKTLLKHYSVTNKDVQVRKLLECRARLYYRAGRLAQAWPGTPFQTKKALAAIESKYAKEMAEAAATQGEVRRKYAEPQAVCTGPAKGASAASGGRADKAEVPARLRVEVLGEEDVPNDSASRGAAVSEGGGGKNVQAHEVPQADVVGVPREPWEQLGRELWARVSSENLLHVYVMQQESAEQVQVVRAEASSPEVWQARALTAIACKALVLVPWVKSAPALLEDGAALKRAGSMHAALPRHEVMGLEAKGCTDACRFLLRSPLGAKALQHAPAAFWCVLAVADAASANMEFRECVAEGAAPTVTLQGSRKADANKAPKVTVQTKFRVLPYVLKLVRGEVLTVCAPPEGDAGPGPAEPAPKRAREAK